MSMKFSKVGAWDAAQKKIASLAKNITEANLIVMAQVGLKAEQIAVKHMAAQDLNWKPLSPRTLKLKQKKRLSNKILIATSTYFQNITSWVDKHGSEPAAYIGVRRTVMTKDGKDTVANIAAIHEFGSKARNIPARPLWRPVQKELRAWLKANKPFKKMILARL